jgi:shikimate 5-dehydrogenase
MPGGFLDALEAIYPMPLRGVRASVLGAGGSARAVVAALTSRGASVTVHARRREQAEQTAAAFEAAVGESRPGRGSWDVLVNCTPLGRCDAAQRVAIAGCGAGWSPSTLLRASGSSTTSRTVG